MSWGRILSNAKHPSFLLPRRHLGSSPVAWTFALTLNRALPGAPPPVAAFKRRGADFVVARHLPELVAGMNARTDEPLIDLAALHRVIAARDRELDNPFGKDAQLAAIRGARAYLGDKLIRVARPLWVGVCFLGAARGGRWLRPLGDAGRYAVVDAIVDAD